MARAVLASSRGSPGRDGLAACVVSHCAGLRTTLSDHFGVLATLARA